MRMSLYPSLPLVHHYLPRMNSNYIPVHQLVPARPSRAMSTYGPRTGEAPALQVIWEIPSDDGDTVAGIV